MRRPICVGTNPIFRATPGPIGLNDSADPNNRIYIPKTREHLGLLSNYGGILLAQKGGIAIPSKQKVSYKKLFSKMYDFLSKFEGNVRHMYLDKKGLVHTGIGFNIDKFEAASKYNWLILDKIPAKKGSAPAKSDNRTKPDVRRQPLSAKQEKKDWTVWQEWNKIRNLQRLKGMGGKAFEKYTLLRLKQEEIDTEFKKKVWWRYNALKKVFTKFDDFPGDAQLAMWVHSWGCHPKIYPREWPEYYEACKNHKWIVAGVQSHVETMRKERYEEMKAMFINAWIVEEAKKRGYTKYKFHEIYWRPKWKK